ncbi:unnamed protein product [Cylindrotheca closterium]|uniref:Uncharacterized protein n=1 Tax=Cylindrotheca closterium TaxID=2856 RepID=A0AAD2FKR3_9STRA|nr:unnamed protein product [Cylindrotheca closterium]
MGVKHIFKKHDKAKKRVKSPGAVGRDGTVQSSPSYQYAINEFAQTVAPATSNDDGKSKYRQQQQELQQNISTPQHQQQQTMPNQQSNIRPQDGDAESGTVVFDDQSTASSRRTNEGGGDSRYPFSPHGTLPSEYMIYSAFSQTSQSRLHQEQQYYHPTIVDATYDEKYGDAYLGAPIKYIYPSGYQSMRPRSGPWKLSIFVCMMFTWLSVFIIGHCSDHYESIPQYEVDDDTVMAINTRWCGSQLLYMMWVLSMSITGMAAAYMGIIGYIKMRDFAVANGRSQPPGMTGRSDYYVAIRDGPSESRGNDSGYRPSIYQADGTPQFWGGHIYRPTQAAVAVTSR